MQNQCKFMVKINTAIIGDGNLIHYIFCRSMLLRGFVKFIQNLFRDCDMVQSCINYQGLLISAN
ncbi:hypothetical protein BpHYR1_032125 [Brachionus plicatilis]|uniref:Uncharacterized protein n=1 Tax=Brachionus plicatilis TaxID=10195 RepID=A0A3M7PL77_BRAPC|nr:hypothetical protein BpHYR1_032125 [Brachionus plicatilis]